MSCNTPTSIGRSLSPSDESRFVPHSSVVEAASVMEQYFRDFTVSKQDEEADGKKVHGQEEAGGNKTAAIGNTDQDSNNELARVADGEKSGIMGATICFTPESSPRSSPNLEGTGRASSNLDSINSHSNDYIGSINGVTSSGSGVDGVSSRMSSSAMHIPSSLDGRSTTEYEILDGISSKGTIEVEDLILDGEDDVDRIGGRSDKKKEVKSEGNYNQVGNETAAMLANMSPISTLPSLSGGGDDGDAPTLPSLIDDSPLEMFKTPQPDETKKTSQVPDEDHPPLRLNFSSGDTTADKELKEAVSMLTNLSPSITLLNQSNIGDDDNAPTLSSLIADSPLEMFKSPKPEANETPQVPDEDHPHVSTNSKGLKLDLSSFDDTVNKELKDGDSSNTSPKVDEQPLTPFKNLHKFWECQSTFVHMTKSVIGRILHPDTTNGVDLDATEDAEVDLGVNTPKETAANRPVKGTPVNTERTVGERSFLSEKSTQPSDDNAGTQRRMVEHVVEDIPKTNTFALPFVQAKDTLSSIVCSVLSFVVSASILFGVFIYGPISSVLDMAKTMFGQTLLRKMMKELIAQDTIEVDKAPQDKIDKAAMNHEYPFEHTGTNLSKLFLDEAELGSLEESTQQTKVEEHKGISNSDIYTMLGHQDQALSKRINDKVTASIITKCKKALSVLKSTGFRYAISSCTLISVILMCTCTIQRGIEVSQGCDSGAQDGHVDIHSIEVENLRCFVTHTTSFVAIPIWELNLSPTLFEPSFQEEPVYIQSLKEEDLRCFATQMTSFVSIPLWELNLSPSSFESSFEEGLLGEEDLPKTASSWMFIFVTLSLAALLCCAFVFKSKIPSHSNKVMITGIWTEEEHQEFLEGYTKHGSQWKLVSAFVPTRTPTQVKSHGSYWLKIRSPQRMTKARKASATPNSSKKKRTPEIPSSVSSTTSTPRKSNKTKAIAPLKGILSEKNRNKVTPRSEGRTRRMREMQGSKSDPVKRVRIRVP
mmetsp:Transcript_26190/g.56218  ORF Transcript_26190/g.56218 Transcript_26190/m.56218 type:complete len:990 (-) Transcript_26190:180-3149(-)|eukprot:CAMPEP_0172319810 /NCGR_PEP_ID=MMETSP1058-20130122/38774_1 /TAXON_ID=83371 /ORGANISM="Detonula confervacea, Strain CCMP 353" /LENGTH=989 /DNA_ID=CAMNT_0013034937 /DNA_START=191 /DNA_END=3160 /DNA_ORIENTATION=+